MPNFLTPPPDRGIDAVSDPTTNIKPFLAVVGVVFTAGVIWADLVSKIDAKADAEKVEAVERRVEQEARDAAAESRINRILLCRMPEIRPDSHCEGYR
jgi:hypothetical protein